MPIYDFECKKCGRRFEELVSSYKNSDKVVCVECGSNELKRVYDGKHYLGIVSDSSSDFSDYSDFDEDSDDFCEYGDYCPGC